MNNRAKFALFAAIIVLTCGGCMTGLNEPTVPPTPGTLVAPAAGTLRAALATGATYCMEPGFAWGPVTLDACTATNVDTINYSVTGLLAGFSFDSATRVLSLAAGTTVVPSYTTAMPVTYTCISADDPTVTASVTLNFNDCDGGGAIDGFEDANSATPALIDNVGYVSLTVRNVDEYLVTGTIENRRKIRTNLTEAASMIDVAGLDVTLATDDTGDIDGDRIANNDDDNVFIRFSDASVTGTKFASAQNAGRIASGDLNNDGFPDLIVANDDGLGVISRISTYLNDGAGGFAIAFNNAFAGVLWTVRDMTVGDFDVTGSLGVAFTVPNDNRFIIAGGDGMGFLKLNQTETIALASADYIVGADFNNDTFLDVGVTWGNVLRIYLNNGFGFVALANSYATCNAPTDAANADFDDDGNMDIALSCNPDNVVSVFFGMGDGQFDAPVNFAAGGEPMNLAIADYNLDGFLDIGIGSTAGGAHIQIILCNGNGTCQAVQTFDLTAGRALAAADMDGDGDPDLVFAGGNFLRVEINGFVETQGTLGFTETIYALGGTGSWITVGDYDGNNMIDTALTDQNVPPATNISVFLQSYVPPI